MLPSEQATGQPPPAPKHYNDSSEKKMPLASSLPQRTPHAATQQRNDY